MIRWCTYCASFIGEKEPYQDFTITHSICRSCKVKFKNKNDFDWIKLNEISNFFSSLGEENKELLFYYQILLLIKV